MNLHIFTNVKVLDCTGEEPFYGEVKVENNEITAIARDGTLLERDGAMVHNGEGRMTLMPGLVESHAHLSIDNTDDLAALGRIPPEEHTLLTMHNARLYLDHGITSCISAASAKPRLDVVIRNAIEKGEIPGPRLLAATPWLTVTGGLGDMRTLHMPKVDSMALMADGPEEYRRLTRELIREGVDIIKLVISGDSFVPHAGSETTIMSETEVAAAAEVAHAHGKRLSAHARSAESVKLCVRHGIKVIYHANYADEEALDLLEANRDWLFVSPNIGFTAIAAYEGSEWFTEEQVQTMGFRDELESAVSGVQALMKRGVRILGGGDYGFMITPHGRNARDLDHFIKHCGMTAMESILTMTQHGGAAMDMPTRLGQIKEGFLADLLLVDGDPLEDPKVLLKRENLRIIMKDGILHKHSI
ncbi:MAG: amidohydrolase family protein [Verrucomicrobiota bacterium]|jgi:imidazolonepropionase-like amidohydrolase|nr:amidohydrolase family protein [Verrucomicrobiota bacterium]MEE2942831.1 amidohydrolase family protein [Verrucomicrobiota bacterium]|tara:strand:+ start:802 stop:2049 length:1248 start_codon:yes stop_codon:yes gene_type:complete